MHLVTHATEEGVCPPGLRTRTQLRTKEASGVYSRYVERKNWVMFNNGHCTLASRSPQFYTIVTIGAFLGIPVATKYLSTLLLSE